MLRSWPHTAAVPARRAKAHDGLGPGWQSCSRRRLSTGNGKPGEVKRRPSTGRRSVKVKHRTPSSASEVVAAPPTRQNRNGFAYVAIDGDACLFNQDYLVQGRRGGWVAAEIMLKELRTIFGLADDRSSDIVTQLFIHQTGITSFLWNKYRVHPTVFAAFLEGFAEADPLIHVVLAGPSKEGADAKLRKCLRFHLELDQCTHAAFAGIHDSGYSPMLRSLVTQGYSDKLVLLKTNDEVAQYVNFSGPEPVLLPHSVHCNPYRDIRALVRRPQEAIPYKRSTYGIHMVDLPQSLFMRNSMPTTAWQPSRT